MQLKGPTQERDVLKGDTGVLRRQQPNTDTSTYNAQVCCISA